MSLDRYEKDLDALITKGGVLESAMRLECSPREFRESVKKRMGHSGDGFIQALPSFKDEYQSWYSEAKALVRQLLPNRLSDFTRQAMRSQNRVRE